MDLRVCKTKDDDVDELKQRLIDVPGMVWDKTLSTIDATA